jgi:hypothetical protein
MLSNSNYRRRHEIDWNRYPSVVFESDDWGACERTTDTAIYGKYCKIMRKYIKGSNPSSSTLETPADLERLFSILRKYSGIDSLPCIFTAFTCMGNPDFAAIRANGFSEYVDIGLDKGVPAEWERGDIAGMMRNGFEKGVWAPEFHSFLHHTSPVRWMERLNASGQEGKKARELFEINCYFQGEHVPEYDGLNVKEQFDWVSRCMTRFNNIFGFMPQAAVTSDAYPETEIVWAANGITAICLKNCRINTGEIVVYPTKPWNMQNVYEKIGNFNPSLNSVYITRNVFFECAMFTGAAGGHSTEEVVPVINNRLNVLNEPAVISTHRLNYVNLDNGLVELRFRELEKLLAALQKKGAYFLTTGEVADLYRSGWSCRKFGKQAVLRKWAKDADPIKLQEQYKTLTALPEHRKIKFNMNDLDSLACGNYMLTK